MNRFILFFCLSIILISCEASSDTKETLAPILQEKTSNTSNTSDLEKTIQNQVLTGSIFETHFDKPEQAAILTLKKEFDKGMSKGRLEGTVQKCYEFHNWLIRSNYFDKLPIQTSFPYNGTFQLDATLVSTELSGIWTNKCGFQKEDDSVLHYFCLDANAKIMVYFQELAKDNPTIRSFTEAYAKNKAISQQDIQGYILSSMETLDFANLDHQLFHMLFHSTLNEEQIAIKQLK